MSFELPRLPINFGIVTKEGFPTPAFQRWWQEVVELIEAQEARQDELLTAIVAAQDAADTAAAAAEAAQTAADNAQAAVEAIEVPPTGTRTVSANTALTGDDYAVLVDASGGALSITLPPAATAMNSITITKIDASANAVNITPFGADEINESGSPIAITTQFSSRTFNSDGTADWYG